MKSSSSHRQNTCRFMQRSRVQILMNYTLSNAQNAIELRVKTWRSVRNLWPYMKDEKKWLMVALVAILVNSGLTIWAPIATGNIVDSSILRHDWPGVIRGVVLLLTIFIGTLLSG